MHLALLVVVGAQQSKIGGKMVLHWTQSASGRWCLPLIVLSLLKMALTFRPNPLCAMKHINPSAAPMSQIQHRRSMSPLHVVSDREPDIVEMMVGGERYEMVPLPDRMCDTTLFVGNLCEFVNDDDLSQLFQTVSSLQSVPACVVRKANMQSLRYGFVSFITVEEKEVSHWEYARYKTVFTMTLHKLTSYQILGRDSPVPWE